MRVFTLTHLIQIESVHGARNSNDKQYVKRHPFDSFDGLGPDSFDDVRVTHCEPTLGWHLEPTRKPLPFYGTDSFFEKPPGHGLLADCCSRRPAALWARRPHNTSERLRGNCKFQPETFGLISPVSKA